MVRAQKDNEHEQRWPSAMTAIPPRLNPLWERYAFASYVSGGNGNYASICVVALSYWKKDRNRK